MPILHNSFHFCNLTPTGRSTASAEVICPGGTPYAILSLFLVSHHNAKQVVGSASDVTPGQKARAGQFLKKCYCYFAFFE
jgi:hypothetical protein